MRDSRLIGVVGAGAVGSILAASLTEAGARTLLLARGLTFETIRILGVQVQLSDCVIHVPAQTVHNFDGHIEQCDVLFVAVKRYHTAEIVAGCQRWLKPDGLVVTIQNGLNADLDFAGMHASCTSGIVFTSAERQSPGFVQQFGKTFRVTFGFSDLPGWLCTTMRASRMEVDVRSDMGAAIWRKTIFIATIGGLCCLFRDPVGILQNDPELSLAVRVAFEEGMRVGAATGIQWPDGLEDSLVNDFINLPSDMRPSMLVDLEHGRPLELAWLSGAIASRAARVDFPAPLHGLVSHVLEPYALGSSRSAIR